MLAVRGLNLRLIIGRVLYVLAILGLRTCTVTLCTACQPWCIRWCDRGPSNHSGDHSGTGSCVSCVQRSSRLYISRRVDTRPCSDFSVSILDLVDSFRLDHAHCVHPIIHIPGKGGGERRTRCKYARQARDDVCHDQETHIVTPVTAPDIGETMNAAVAPTSSDVRSFVSGAFALQ